MRYYKPCHYTSSHRKIELVALLSKKIVGGKSGDGSVYWPKLLFDVQARTGEEPLLLRKDNKIISTS